jgi:death-on-curing protein
VSYLTPGDVLDIHSALTVEFAGTLDAVEPPGVKNMGALESAVLRPQTAQKLFPTVLLAGAALVHGLNSNHAFHNGNKRTSLLALAIFLERLNGRYIEATEDQLFDLIVGIAAHTIVDDSPGRESDPYYADREVLGVYWALRAVVVTPRHENRALKWRELVPLLERFGCEVGDIRSNQAKIRRALPDGRVLTAVAGARNAGTEIDADQIRGYRKQLELDDAHLVDSAIFYDGRDPHPELPELIRRYRGVLERLSMLDRT